MENKEAELVENVVKQQAIIHGPLATQMLSQKTITMEALASMEKGQGVEMIEKAVSILNSLRDASISLTYPQDWVLYRDEEGNVRAYLQDSGCQRIMEVWGIHLYNISAPQKIVEGDDFIILIRGDGVSMRTGKTIESVEGCRASNEDFCLGKVGAELLSDVIKAARANLNGCVVRYLTGMNSVAGQELERVWKASGQAWKALAGSVKGRGYGSQAERRGLQTGETPPCPVCGGPTKRKDPPTGKRWDPFFSCRKYPKCEGSMKVSEWKRQKAKNSPSETTGGGNGTPEAQNEPGAPDTHDGDVTPTTVPEIKNHLLLSIENLPPSVKAKFKADIMQAKDLDQLRDVEIQIQDRLNTKQG